MENSNRRTSQYGYQPGTDNRGYQPSSGSNNNTQSSSNTGAIASSQPPKGGNVAQND